MHISAVKDLLEQSGFQRTVSQVRAAGGGLYNESYVLEGSDGKYILRIAPPDNLPKLFYEVEMMRSEPEVHRLVRQRTDVPVPAILHSDFSRRIMDRDFLVMEYLPGGPGPFSPRELGEYVRQLHEIKAHYYGYPERQAPTGQSWPELFYTYVRLIFDDCLRAGALDPGEHKQFLNIYESHRGVFTEDVPKSLLHLDLWSANILTDRGRITAILDFDRGLYGDPELEFAVLDTYANSTADFFSGYGTPRPSGADAAVRRRLYLVYELIKYAFIKLARGGSPATARRFVRDCRAILEGDIGFSF